MDYTDLDNPTLIAAQNELNRMEDTIRALYPMLVGNAEALAILTEPCQTEICARYGVDHHLLMIWVMDRVYHEIKEMVATRRVGSP